jgi:signal transduction histidine kinase
MDDHEWSAATDQHFALFNDQRPGEHVFQVKAVDAMGREIDAVSIKFEILAPFYIKWYMNVLYLIVIAFFIYLLVRYRISHLEREKLRLESVVNERTAEIVKQRDEIVKQKDEIEEKSRSLESALDELGQAQNELIRQEKMAMVGKLTQGLIDRILNPLNYINNFAKLSIGLVKDVKTNIDDEKEHMSEDNYEDTVDVLGMLSSNLEKVGEHGQNTTRTLKAMEEMLKDRSGGIIPMNLAIVLRQNEEMFRNYYANEIANEGIKATFSYPSTELPINGNAEMLSKCFMSMLANSVYAILKKSQREKYKPEITFSVTDDNSNLIVTLRDNGIGIEKTIINKVFDPFFTTKPTGEASGVGLYLSREIIQNHQGDISVKSVKNEYTEFTIVLPKNK